MPRILVDCSNIRLQPIPTGIPRVVASYIKYGSEWCKERGYEMVLVVPNKFGVARAECFLYLERADLLSSVNAVDRFAVYAKIVANYLSDRFLRWAFHLCMFLGLLLPVRHHSVEAWANQLVSIAARVSRVFVSLFDRLQWKLLDVPLQEDDVLFCPAYWHDVEPDVYRKISQRGCRIFFLVHDILPITHARYYPTPWREEFKANVVASFPTVDAYFCISATTQKELTALAGQISSVPIRTMLAPNGNDLLPNSGGQSDSSSFAQICDLYPTFLITVGTIEPKKQHTYLLDQLSDLWDAGYNLPLLIIGRRGWMDQEIVDRIAEHPRLGKKLFWLTDMTDNDLLIAYSRARFLLFCSVAEGFGLPIVEALQSGLPVILFDTATTREIAGDYGLYFDRRTTHVSGLLLEYFSDSRYLQLKARVADFWWPTWSERVGAVLSQIDDAVASTPGLLSEHSHER